MSINYELVNANAPNSCLYCVYDKVSHRFSHFMFADNNAMYVREMIAHRVAFPLNFDDLEVYKVCTLSEFCARMDLEPVSWSDWREPQSKAELLAPLGLSNEEQVEISKNLIARKNSEVK